MRKVLFVSIMVLFVMLSPRLVRAWDGWDYENGAAVEIGDGNLVRDGEVIEAFDYNTGEYRDFEVIEINRYGNAVEIELVDAETGQQRVFTMDDE